MKRNAGVLALLLALSSSTAVGQETAVNLLSKQIAEAEWTVDTLAAGILWRKVHFEPLLGLPLFVSLLDVDLGAPGLQVDLVQSDTGLTATSQLASMAGAIAAVNGSYFEKDGRSSGFLQENGIVLQPDDDNRTHFSEEGAVATTADFDALIVRRSQSVWQASPSFADVLVAGPLLVWDGEVVDSHEVLFNITHHPRTAAGLTPDNHLILITVDGRNAESAGMTTRELALFMQAVGCQAALNLDGGGSTTMWIDGHGVVNHPSDNRLYDADGERAVANALIVRKR